MAIEKQEQPRRQSAQRLLTLHHWSRFVIVAGRQRTGKTEWMLSLATALSKTNEPVYVGDLTEERSFLCDQGVAILVRRTAPDVRVLVPDVPGLCDLEGLQLQVAAAMKVPEARVIVDTGTNGPALFFIRDMRETLLRTSYDFHLVINPLDREICNPSDLRALRIYAEAQSGLPVTGAIVNAFGGGEDPRTVARASLDAYYLIRELDLPHIYTLVDDDIAEVVCSLLPEDLPVWSLQRMLKREEGKEDGT